MNKYEALKYDPLYVKGNFQTHQLLIGNIMKTVADSATREEAIENWVDVVIVTNEIAQEVVSEFSNVLEQLKERILNTDHRIDETKAISDTLLMFEMLKNNTESKIPREETIFINTWAMRILEEHDVDADEVEQTVREKYLEEGKFDFIDCGFINLSATWTKDEDYRYVVTIK